jgi:alpha-tubulin suppressor-like RCC1 family protein
LPSVSAKSVSAGDDFTCAVTSSGGAMCWGFNSFGQLGNNSTALSLVAVGVVGLSAGVQGISAGGGHACAVTATGGVKCWGNNTYGELGNNSTVSSPVPVEVTGLASGIQSVSAGADHTCALTAENGVKCWGNNQWGQLCNNSTATSLVPVDATCLSGSVDEISAAYGYTCGLIGGAVSCWGYNVDGELGNGSTTTSEVPVGVRGLSAGTSAVSAANQHACALTTTGAVKCWGYNVDGELGNESGVIISLPFEVSGLSTAVQAISVSQSHVCALTRAGAVECWGSNESGELGNNSVSNSPEPVEVTGLGSGIQSISAGVYHTCALTAVGGVECWGSNHDGALGDNSRSDSPVPVRVVGF